MKNVIILLYGLILTTCSNNKQFGDLKTLIVDTEQEQKVNLSEIASHCEVIHLETNDSCLISGIKKIKKVNDLYYISDAIFQGVYIFDKKGKYIKRFFKQGKAPGEYISISDFVIDVEMHRLEILDMSQKKILKYDIENFNFLEEVEIPVKFCASLIKNKNYYYFQTNGTVSSDENYEVDLYNLETKEFKHIIRGLETNDNRHIQFQNIFTQNSIGEGFVSLAWNDTIYKLNKEVPKPLLKINCQELGIPNHIKIGSYDERLAYIKSKESEGRFGFIKMLMCEEKDMVFTYSKLPTLNSGFLFLFGNGKKTIYTDCIINDITKYPHEIKNIFQIDNRELLSVFYPGNYSEDSVFLKNLGVSENDNPILLVANI